LHSHKLIATLQYELAVRPKNPMQLNPLIIRVDVRAGHGAGKPTKMVIEEVSDLMSFAAR
jgi:prolyl oligopeptidase